MTAVFPQTLLEGTTDLLHIAAKAEKLIVGYRLNNKTHSKGAKSEPFVDAENIEEAFVKLQEKSYTSIITMGEKGSAVITSEEIVHTPKANIEPIDTNGAGDMFAGSFMYALLQDNDLKSCAEFANYGASKVVETFGPRLTQESYKEVLNNFKKS